MLKYLKFDVYVNQELDSEKNNKIKSGRKSLLIKEWIKQDENLFNAILVSDLKRPSSCIKGQFHVKSYSALDLS